VLCCVVFGWEGTGPRVVPVSSLLRFSRRIYCCSTISKALEYSYHRVAKMGEGVIDWLLVVDRPTRTLSNERPTTAEAFFMWLYRLSYLCGDLFVYGCPVLLLGIFSPSLSVGPVSSQACLDSTYTVIPK
jgi:hypothetical protein